MVRTILNEIADVERTGSLMVDTALKGRECGVADTEVIWLSLVDSHSSSGALASLAFHTATATAAAATWQQQRRA